MECAQNSDAIKMQVAFYEIDEISELAPGEWVEGIYSNLS